MTLIEPAREQMSQDEVIGKLGRQRRQEKRGSRRRPPGAAAAEAGADLAEMRNKLPGIRCGLPETHEPRGCGCVEGPTEYLKGSSVTFLRKCPPGFGQPLLKSA